jgi:hypothetical protein
VSLERGTNLEVRPVDNAPSVGIGTVTTLAAGQPATVTNVGSAQNAVLNFAIPQGANGTSPANPAFSVAANGLSAGASPTVGLTGSYPNLTLTFGIPAGAAGTNGVSPNITIGSVTTLSSGSSATASLTGTFPNLSLNLGIPMGATGSGSTVAWGGITGTLSSQTDLQTALNARVAKSGDTMTGTLGISHAAAAKVQFTKTGAAAGTAEIYNDGSLTLIPGASGQPIVHRALDHDFYDYTGANLIAQINDATKSVIVSNNGNLRFRDSASNTAALGVSAGDSLALYGTDAAGAARAIFDIAMRSNTSGLNFSVPLTAPTPAPGDNDTSVATTAFVHAELASLTSVGGNLIGYRNLPTSRSLNANDTLADADKGKKIVWTGGVGTITLNPNATTPIDTDAIGTIVNDGSGNLTLARGAGVTAKLIGTGVSADRVIPPGCVATWFKTGTNSFYVGGANVT